MHSNLPHKNLKSHYQFITFRTKDSTDAFVQKLLAQNNIETKILQHQIDAHLDNSQSGAYLNGTIVELTKKYLLNIDETICKIIAFSIMPNHIHILLTQNIDLAKVVQQIKGGLAFVINKELGKKGPLWQKDYFDKGVRDEKHFELVYKYIKNNALKAGLVDAENRFYGIYE